MMNGEEEEKESEENTSPLKAAADLIQTLDIAYSEMNSCAADAARDAEDARRNARAASEIARRYLNRSYPKDRSPFGAASVSTPSPMSFTQNRGESKFDISQELIEIGAEDHARTPHHLKTPDQNHIMGRSSRRTFKTPSSSERLAQSHADDVLSLSLDLERSKQALKSEQRMHDETKASLAAVKSKNKSLEEQNQKLLDDMEKERGEAKQKMGALEQDLARTNYRMEAAEEDAQFALDLAKESAEKRDQMEDFLQKALQELERLRAQHNSAPRTPKRSVRFADTTQSLPPKPPPPPQLEEPTPIVAEDSRRPGPSRSMIAAGRQLLRRAQSPNHEQAVVTLEYTPVKSAERRNRLRERLKSMEDDAMLLSPPRQAAAAASPRMDAGFTTGTPNSKVTEECKNVAKLLQESGGRLDLGGHWWRDAGKSSQPDVHLEAMARQYCQSVEVSPKRSYKRACFDRVLSLTYFVCFVYKFKIDRQKKNLGELKSLCDYLEQKLPTSND
jgi:chromosome segregation ATPase